MTGMNTKENLVRAVIEAAGGEVIGRIRLQKIFYLLEQLGAQGELRFSYHHFGPYSRELSDTLDWLVLDGVIEDVKIPTDGGSYSIYKSKEHLAPHPAALGALPWERVQSMVAEMKQKTSPVIELAATIHWLQHKEQVTDWRKELKVRKPGKATDERIDDAMTLLHHLNLAA